MHFEHRHFGYFREEIRNARYLHWHIPILIIYVHQKSYGIGKNQFGRSGMKQLLAFAKYFGIFMVELGIAYYLCYASNILSFGNLFVEFVVKVVVGMVITGVLSGAVFAKTDEFGYFKEMLKKAKKKVRG